MHGVDRRAPAPPRRTGRPRRRAGRARSPPPTPAAAAAARNASRPRRSTGFAYVITATGIPTPASRIVARTSSTVAPASRASADACWITPPSMIGSECGIPTSIASAPASREAPQQAGVDARVAARSRRGRTPCAPASRARAQRGLERGPRRPSPAPRGPVSRSLSPRPDRHTRTRVALGERPTEQPADHVGGLERRQDPLGPRERLEPRERLLVGGAVVAGEPRVPQVRVLGPDARIVQAGRDRVRRRRPGPSASCRSELSAPWSTPGSPSVSERQCWPRLAPAPAGLDPDQLDARRADERREHADRVRAAADAREHVRRGRRPSAPRTGRAPRRRSPAGGRARAPGTGAARRPTR